ncbi:MAG: HDOD domain-containing protein, partial [Treponema sp.]|nr:HDOD domain-containing protein [Treponema sp.]
KLVGLRGIKNLLYSIGSMKALTEDSNEEIKALWTHAYRIAFYSYNLARNFLRTDKKCVDDSYVCGLLHDMGKIIFETAHPEVLDKISAMCEERGVSKNLFERMFAGVNHGDVGSLIAKKWNFPEVIINAIRYHHDPLSAPEEFRKITTLIYFADMLSHYSEGNFDYSLIEPSALKMFGITSEEALKVLADKLDNSFKKEQH